MDTRGIGTACAGGVIVLIGRAAPVEPVGVGPDERDLEPADIGAAKPGEGGAGRPVGGRTGFVSPQHGASVTRTDYARRLFGSVWSTATAGSPTTVLLKELGASPFQFGVLAALPFIASLLSLPARLLTERTGERKKIILYGLFWQGG